MFSKAVAFVCIACAFSIAVCAVVPGWTVRPDGIGPVKVGMTLAQLNLALNESFAMPADKEEQQCFYVNTDRHPSVSFMIENGRVVRVDIDGADTPTTEGIHVGDPVAKVERAYGLRLRAKPNFYEPQERYLTLASADRLYAIRFETDKGKIRRFYAGRLSAVSYVEGCL